MPSSPETIILTVTADPHLARLVRMTAANAATLSAMSVDRVEDVRMAAEEAFILSCSVAPGEDLTISFDVTDEHVGLTFGLACDSLEAAEEDDAATYADLILAAVCDGYTKSEQPATLTLDLKADV